MTEEIEESSPKSLASVQLSAFDFFTPVDKMGKPFEVNPFDTDEDFKLWLVTISNHKDCHMMIDLETVGLIDSSTIVQVGLAPFSPTGTGLFTYPYKGKEISFVHNEVLKTTDQKRFSDPETIKWWYEKNKANVHLLTAGTTLLVKELKALSFLLPRNGNLWANSPTFDIDIIRHACKQWNVPLALSFRNEWDVRTATKMAGYYVSNKKGLYKESEEFWSRPKNVHDALNDVFSQIYEVQHCFRKLGITPSVLTGNSE